MRKCNQLMQQNIRALDRDILRLRNVEVKTRSLIVTASKRGQKNPSQAASAAAETRTFARELVRVRKHSARLAASKAQLESVKMQVNEAFAVRRIEGSIRASTGIMKQVNTLVRLPELTGTMRELSQELMKAGIIEEMVGDMLPGADIAEAEDEEAELEVDKVLGEILKTPGLPETATDEPAALRDDEPLEESEDTLAQMRGRLEALKS